MAYQRPSSSASAAAAAAQAIRNNYPGASTSSDIFTPWESLALVWANDSLSRPGGPSLLVGSDLATKTDAQILAILDA